MGCGDPADPLLRQVLPVAKEDESVSGFTEDPVGELLSSPVDFVLHKYQGRALMIVTGACAVHCRYCFRRHFPYAEVGTAPGWDGAVDRIASDPTISEVILSGGDPLTMTDSQIEVLGRKLAALPFLKRLRIHTRLPIVLPRRVDGALTSWIGGLGLPTIVVVHANHANEIDDDVRRALAALAATGVTLLNQTVLLAGVNDSVDALSDLSEALFDSGVLAYYLHSSIRFRERLISLSQMTRQSAFTLRLRPGSLVISFRDWYGRFPARRQRSASNSGRECRPSGLSILNFRVPWRSRPRLNICRASGAPLQNSQLRFEILDVLSEPRSGGRCVLPPRMVSRSCGELGG